MKRVYRFGGREAEGNGQMRNLLGGKGANLAEMCTLGIPVPAGFTITTECCTEYYALGGGYTYELKHDVATCMKLTIEEVLWTLEGFFGAGASGSQPATPAS